MSQYSMGFTGTSDGMSAAQKVGVRRILTPELARLRRMNWLPLELHHGDCIGADGEFSAIADTLGDVWIEVHPSDHADKRAWSRFDFCHPPKPPLKRNPDIVDAGRYLIAAPRGMQEELRSGTWATVRYARKRRVPIIFVYPNGTIFYDHSDHSKQPDYSDEFGELAL